MKFVQTIFICIAHIILLPNITAKLYHVNKMMYRDIIQVYGAVFMAL